MKKRNKSMGMLEGEGVWICKEGIEAQARGAVGLNMDSPKSLCFCNSEEGVYKEKDGAISKGHGPKEPLRPKTSQEKGKGDQHAFTPSIMFTSLASSSSPEEKTPMRRKSPPATAEV